MRPVKYINSKRLKSELSNAELTECALRENADAKLSSSGALVIRTGAFTGRAASDKYVVEENYSMRVIDWENNIHKMSSEVFDQIKNDIIESFNSSEKNVYLSLRCASASLEFALGVKLYTTSAAHCLFSNIIFRERSLHHPMGEYTIYHAPDFHVDSAKYETKSSTVIAINFSTNEILIAGTGYAGEIKKSIFSVLNTLLPDFGVLPMHAGANLDLKGRSSLFFGLSGTGKTTLSTDVNMAVIGDDEHGMSSTGIFNFEGGCYAKTDGLSVEKEPDIFHAANRFGSILENVVLDSTTREPDFTNRTITENGRATYPLTHLQKIVSTSRGSIPANIFFLSADATGVLPAVSRLDNNQAMFYFLSGFSAKLAGTETGMTGVKETFSHCFGAPFMMRSAMDYGHLLKDFLAHYPIRVWLINTGWYGGPYGIGERYPLSVTRKCIRAIQAAPEDNFAFEKNIIFQLNVPVHLDGVDNKYLMPEKLWKDEGAYLLAAEELKRKFDKNYERYLEK